MVAMILPIFYVGFMIFPDLLSFDVWVLNPVGNVQYVLNSYGVEAVSTQ